MDLTRTTTSLTVAGAEKVLAAARAEAERIGVAMNIAIADPGGHLICFLRMDGAALMSGSIAQDKAYTVAAFGGLPTHGWFDLIKDEPALREGIVHRPRLTIFGGGVPVRDAQGVLVGTIGVSGGSAAEDRQVAEAGAAGLLSE